MKQDKKEKTLKGRALRAVYRAVLRGSRSKYFPHIGAKQLEKIKERQNEIV